MTYQAGPVETYETAEGCIVVSQKQTTQAGVEIENVCLMVPKKPEVQEAA